MGRRGYTLAELAIYCFLAVLLLVALVSLFVSGRRLFEGASGSYIVSAEFEAGVRFLRADLKETSLVTVRVFPHPGAPTARPGVSFESARSYDDGRTFLVSPHGAPQWDKHVFYTLDEKGTLWRWERKLAPPSFVPLASVVLPAVLDDPSRKRVVMRNLLVPGGTYEGVGPRGRITADPHGGFQVAFVRQTTAGGVLDEALTDWNPAQVSDGEAPGEDPRGVTRRLEVRLQGLVSNGLGRPNYYAIRFRVTPRH